MVFHKCFDEKQIFSQDVKDIGNGYGHLCPRGFSINQDLSNNPLWNYVWTSNILCRANIPQFQVQLGNDDYQWGRSMLHLPKDCTRI
mmetsp:Transcript_42518/g.48857  ORF Transcript_42518/g.48857 Transcript_42518/m.48857 type:complete len:87 (-) Transcript_42518:284-544(-)